MQPNNIVSPTFAPADMHMPAYMREPAAEQSIPVQPVVPAPETPAIANAPAWAQSAETSFMQPATTPISDISLNSSNMTESAYQPVAGSGNSPPAPSSQTPIGGSGDDSPLGRIKNFLSKHKLSLIIGGLSVLLLANIGVSVWLFQRVNHYTAQPVSTAGVKGDSTLYVDTQTKSVGIGAAKPEGLQVDSTVTSTARGTANVRAGLLNGQPTIVFEDKNAQQLQLGVNGSGLQLASGTAVYAQLDTNGLALNNNLTVAGNTTLGDAASDTLTLQASTVAAPNSLNFANNSLFVDTTHTAVAIGTNKTNGYKLYVSGNTFNTGTFQVGGQVIVTAGSAKTPAIGIAGSADSGIFSPGGSITSISAAGNEVLRAQPGNVSVVNGSGLNVSGFLQAGDNNPAWKMARFTGTLDGSGTDTVAHGIANAPSRVLVAMAWYEGGGGQAKLLSVDSIDGTSIHVSGGSPGNVPWRGVILYSSDTAGW